MALVMDERISRPRRVLGHEVRLRLMLSLRDREETSVGELENLTGVVQPGLSQQLGILRNAGLVDDEREGRVIRVRANYARMDALLAYLTENCCAGADCGQTCDPTNGSCCPPGSAQPDNPPCC